MYIISGNTMIEFDGTYRLVDVIDENGSTRGIISFNDSNSLEDAPDSKYASNPQLIWARAISAEGSLYSHT